MAEIPDGAAGGNGGNKPDSDNAAPIVAIPPAKRGRGRPPGSGKAAQPANAPRPPAADPDSKIDAATFADLAVSICEIGDNVCCSLLLSKARAHVPPEHLSAFTGELERIRLGSSDKATLHKAFVALGKRYDFLLRWGPEIALLVVGAQYSARMGNCYRKLSTLPPLEKKVDGPGTGTDKKT